MNIAFYAPLKSPTSGIPSGDRRMGRALINALEFLGHNVELASEFKSREPSGDFNRQKALSTEGNLIAHKLVKTYRRNQTQPDIWFTYHVYYKAPDWIGPYVSRELNIPYVITEASHAPKRAGGPWDFNHRNVEKAIKQADLVIGLNSLDAKCVKPLLSSKDRYLQLRPFIDLSIQNSLEKKEVRNSLARDFDLNLDGTLFLTVAMMREGAKHKSYEVLAKSLRQLKKSDWNLIIAGDGPLRSNIEELFVGLPVTFVGQQVQDGISKLMIASDIFLWPAVEEAYGMAILEAQSHGLPVIASDSGGVGDIVRDDSTGILTKIGDVSAFTSAIEKLMASSDTGARMSSNALLTVKQEHSLEATAIQLNKALTDLING